MKLLARISICDSLSSDLSKNMSSFCGVAGTNQLGSYKIVRNKKAVAYHQDFTSSTTMGTSTSGRDAAAAELFISSVGSPVDAVMESAPRCRSEFSVLGAGVYSGVRGIMTRTWVVVRGLERSDLDRLGPENCTADSSFMLSSGGMPHDLLGA